MSIKIETLDYRRGIAISTIIRGKADLRCKDSLEFAAGSVIVSGKQARENAYG